MSDVGETDGFCDGIDVGLFEGNFVGLSLGELDGVSDGINVGFCDGEVDGVFVDDVGVVDRMYDGDCVGSNIGDIVGSLVGDTVLVVGDMVGL